MGLAFPEVLMAVRVFLAEDQQPMQALVRDADGVISKAQLAELRACLHAVPRRVPEMALA